MDSWRKWLGGLISAISGAVAAQAGLLITHPEDFTEIQKGMNNILIVSGFAAVVAVLNYLKQSPLPDVNCKDDGDFLK